MPLDSACRPRCGAGVRDFRSSAVRQALAAILLVALTLSGLGRAMAMVDAPAVAETLAGVTVPICHHDAGDPADPQPPGHHDCCDACALCAPVLAPLAPVVAPARVEHRAAHAEALGWAPVIARVPTPRQSQGPPNGVI
ncbi:hypothetical protein P7D22_10270 [Lichenihabitans sp. Uapishka_5]|uniref:hypothetical protein n=1 Tax=Lichenihabitans sp. Uapishka_5 TaxID=3037302 RepID=UPI0029E823D5|nr:hypothetical protein [Lichenihabitans sp. Uapishka_5]MDX7951552.1 hypothetical protein [Lichenihabitans sp. Uapishka_5]